MSEHLGTAVTGFLPSQERELTPDQVGVIQRHARRLAWLAEKPYEPREQSSGYIAQIDSERHNQVLLIDGARGTGKTVTMVSLLETLKRRYQGDDDPLYGLNKAAETIVERRIIPLRILDLRPFPADRSLILELPNVFLRVVEKLESKSYDKPSKDDPPPSWEKDDHPARIAWRKFTHAAATGFARALPGQQLDVGSFVDELVQAGSERATVRDAFHRLIDELAKGVEETDHLLGPPLFVLAIDDADMQPDRCLDILDMVRFFWHPRVAFVLTGDSTLFHSVVRNQMAQWLSKGTSEVFVQHWSGDLAGRAEDLAHQFVEKHLPDRELMVEVERQVRVQIALKGIELPRLHRQLTRMEASLAAALPGNLRALVGLNSELIRIFNEHREKARRLFARLHETYPSAAQNEKARDQFVEGQCGQAIALRLWEQAVGGLPSGEVRRKLEESVTRDEYDVFKVVPGSVALKVRLRRERVRRGDALIETGHDLTFGLVVKQLVPSSVVPVQGGLSRDSRAGFLLGQSPIARQNPSLVIVEEHVDGRVVAAYALLLLLAGELNDAAALLEGFYQESPVTITRASGGHQFVVRWQLPQWNTLDSYLNFYEEWRATVKHLSFESHTTMTKRFVSVVAGVDTSTRLMSLMGATTNAVYPDSWDDILVPVQWSSEWWQTQVALLATPEAGLPAKEANALMAALETRSLADEEQLSALRRRWVHYVDGSHASDEVVSEFFTSLDPDGEYTWGYIVNWEHRLLKLAQGVTSRYESLASILQDTPGRSDEFRGMTYPEKKRLTEAFARSKFLKRSRHNAEKVMEDVWKSLGHTTESVPEEFEVHFFKMQETNFLMIERPALEQRLGQPDHLAARLYRDVRERGASPPTVRGWALYAKQSRYRWPFPAYDRPFRLEQWIDAWSGHEFPLNDTQEFVDGMAYMFIHMFTDGNNRDKKELLEVPVGSASELGEYAGTELVRLVRDGGSDFRDREVVKHWASVAGTFFSSTKLSGVSRDFAKALKQGVVSGLSQHGVKLPTQKKIQAELDTLRVHPK